jgi:C_GCAxxG_C_C family probable redox protein
MGKPERALELYAGGLSCSQAVFSVFADKFNLDEKTMLRISGGFGGGVGSSGLICGAVSGAVMLLGLKYGATEPGDFESKQVTREAVRDFMKKFTDEFGAVDCKCLLGFDLSKPTDFDYVHDNNVTRKVCPKFVEFAVKELEKII